jgi:hypothetical protein
MSYPRTRFSMHNVSDFLAALRRRKRARQRHKNYCPHCDAVHCRTPACPSPDEIARRAAAIRKTWSPQLEISRRGLTPWRSHHTGRVECVEDRVYPLDVSLADLAAAMKDD